MRSVIFELLITWYVFGATWNGTFRQAAGARRQKPDIMNERIRKGNVHYRGFRGFGVAVLWNVRAVEYDAMRGRAVKRDYKGNVYKSNVYKSSVYKSSVYKGSVYKSKQSEAVMMELYDRQLDALNLEYEDLYVDTRFGKAHLVKFGKPDGKPLLIFHGGNNTTPYSLRYYATLPYHFCSYAVDTVGHPGKSSQKVVSHKSLAYGEWASDVITGLGYEKMNCMGASFGGGILVKLMCAAPEKVEKSVLIVPSGLANVSTLNLLVTMGIPMMLYVFTKKDRWLEKAVAPMLGKERRIDGDTFEMVRHSFEHVAVKAGMPSNAKAGDLRNYTAPAFVIASENDCMFPGGKVIEKAEKMINNSKTHLLKGQSHMFSLHDDVIDMVLHFLND